MALWLRYLRDPEVMGSSPVRALKGLVHLSFFSEKTIFVSDVKE